MESIDSVSSSAVRLENGSDLPAASSSNSVIIDEYSDMLHDGDQFVSVSLRDQESGRQGRGMDSLSDAYAAVDRSDTSPGRTMAASDAVLPANITDDNCYIDPVSERLATSEIRPSLSTVSLELPSRSHGESTFSSPVDSPLKQRMKPARPNMSPELLHLVDSAIMGNPGSLEKLRNVVCGKETIGHEEENTDSVARSVVDALLVTMGGVDIFEEFGCNNPPSVMLNSRAAVVAGEIIPWIPCEGDFEGYMSPRTLMVKGLYSILNACTRNRTMCSTAGLLSVLLWSAEKISTEENHSGTLDWDGIPLCNSIQVLAGHSLTVFDLHKWLQVVTRTCDTVWAQHLMLALEKAICAKESRGPACTFEFDGESSGLLGPGDSRWPFSSGYAFASWIYVESFADTLNTATAAAAIAAAAAAKSGKSSAMSAAAAASALAGEGTTHMPRLFSFLSADNQGVEAYFHGHFLVAESGSGKGKKASLHFTHAFKPQYWYFIGLEHTCKQSLLGKNESELRLYVNGALQETRPFDLPWITKPLSFCCIGTNPPPTMAGLQRRRRQCPLFAEMGPVYIFKEPVGPEKMARLASRGGDALPSFGRGAGLPWSAASSHVQHLAEESALLDSEISSSLYLLYHPCLFSGRFCSDASPSGSAGIHRRPAEVLGQVYVAKRMRPLESLWALAYGGPMSLLPLAVSNMQQDSLEPVHGNISSSLVAVSLSASILRIIAMAIQHPQNNEELCRTSGPEVLPVIIHYLLQCLSVLPAEEKHEVRDEEVVAAIVSLCHSQKLNYALKVQLFRNLLLNLKMWCSCNYGLQKKLLSSLADTVFTESSAMRDANAVQILLDGCRQCYWVVHEDDSVDSFPLNEDSRPVGEVNALVDELLVVIELFVGSATSSFACDDVRCLIGFIVDCPQPNQVARVLHLIYRLIAQPNTSRAHIFADAFMSGGGIEALLILLQREVKAGDSVTLCSSMRHVEESTLEPESVNNWVRSESQGKDHLESGMEDTCGCLERNHDEHFGYNEGSYISNNGKSSISLSVSGSMERASSTVESMLLKNLGGICFSISSESARRNVYNVDSSDGNVIGIINLLGALVTLGVLKFSSTIVNSPTLSSSILGNTAPDESSTMFSDKISLLLFALQKAFQAAPRRLMSGNVYMALLGAAINATSTEDGLNLYDSAHRFEHLQLLLVLLRSLAFAPRAFQMRAVQDILFLACSHPENRKILICMEDWPEWILEVLISNYEGGSSKITNEVNIGDIDDLIHNFLIIMLEHSMRQKDGWQDIEAVLHCAEWLSMVGGSSTGDQRIRREKSLPIFKRRLLGGLLDFSARELQVQMEVIAAAAAGVAAEGLPPHVAIAEAEAATSLSVALAENTVVILMFVEDHLRVQSQIFIDSCSKHAPTSPMSLASSTVICDSNTESLNRDGIASSALFGLRRSLIFSDSGGIPVDVLVCMADANGQISAAVMERLTAAAAAEPYESVRCAFASYGSCSLDLAEGWRYRSRLWYGVGLPAKSPDFSGGASGWDSWRSILEKDTNGNWIELPLVKKSVVVLQALLLDDHALGGGLSFGAGSGTGMGMTSLHQFLDSDQPFLCMMRMVLVSMREEDNGEDDLLLRKLRIKDVVEGLNCHTRSITSSNSSNCSSANLLLRKPSHSALLWSVLAPVLNMPISESRRQRVLVASCILYSEVWHAVGKTRMPLRKQYLEAILPPFVAILRRWRPLLAGIHDFTSSDGQNPLIADDHALAADALPIESALAMITPEWAAAFASPPAAMALAMMAAGAAGGEIVAPAKHTPIRRDSLMFERKSTRLHTFSSFQELSDIPAMSAIPKSKAAAKAAALAAARDVERNAKIGSGRGLSAVAMATSAQRRNAGDTERVRRWNVTEAMEIAWMECRQSVDTMLFSGKDLSALAYKYVAVLVGSFALARNVQRGEIDRRAQVALVDRHCAVIGTRAWRKLIRCLAEMKALFGPFGHRLSNPTQVFWKLDFLEGALRMRSILRRNYKGSDHFGAAANYDDYLLRLKRDPDNKALSSSAVFKAITSEENREDDEHLTQGNFDYGLQNVEQDGDNLPNTSTPSEGDVQGSLIFDDGEAASYPSFVQNAVAVVPGYVSNESHERIIVEISAIMVRPLHVVEGTFQVTTKRINFILHDCSRDIRLDGASSYHVQKGHKKNRSWLISSLHQMFSRRYLLRRSALELFMNDRCNFFFDFGSVECRRNAYRAIVHAQPPNLNNIFLATQRPEQLLKRTQLMERWARWEISNFEYLMQLNTLAGRSYNDITQYPVFPWILSDYSSSHLDLSDPSYFRDLSKPVGALNAERLKKFQERYWNFDDPVIPKFHYGSHYSSAGSVLYYLVRVEPFTTLSIQLQGGKFDHADRMFSDVGATWHGVLEDMSDVKELVPELFYLPEVLSNINQIDFGTTQLGAKIDSVKLPPWAKNSVDFVHKHRKALESEHVSAHLHEWVDLIFGYKQRGEAAIAANNIFFHITYEGTIDIDKISDPAQQRAMQDQIAYFGQTPSQLLTVPHLRRKPLQDVLLMQTIFRNPKEIRPYAVPKPECCNVPAAAIFTSLDSVIVVDENAPAAHVALHKWQPNTPDGQGTPFLFQHGKGVTAVASGSLLRMFKGPTGSGIEECHFPQALAFAAPGIKSSDVVAITSDNEIITGGHADNSIKLISSDGARTIETALGHCAPVTCIALSSDSSYLVTGSHDTTVILWRVCRVDSSHFKGTSDSGTSGTSTSATLASSNSCVRADGSTKRRIEGPIHILRGHLGEILCCCVSSELALVVSCSQLAGVHFHSSQRGRLIRSLDSVIAHSVCVSPKGLIMTWNQMEQKFQTFTVNGIPIAVSTLSPFTGIVSCMEVSADGDNVVIGMKSLPNHGRDSTMVDLDYQHCSDPSSVLVNTIAIPVPSICFLDLYTLKILHILPLGEGQNVTALTVSKDNTNLLVSTADKQLIVFTDPALSLKVVDQMLRLGWEGDGLNIIK